MTGPTPPPREEQRRALLALLDHSLKRGHWRLAVRRYLMLRAQSHEVPPPHAESCERLIASASRRELGRIRQQVHDWVCLLARAPR